MEELTTLTSGSLLISCFQDSSVNLHGVGHFDGGIDASTLEALSPPRFVVRFKEFGKVIDDSGVGPRLFPILRSFCLFSC